MNVPLQKTTMAQAMTAKEQREQALDLFDQIFQAHWTRVYGLLLRLVDDPGEAEDLALETFLRLHTSTQRSQIPANIPAWLHVVATNLGLDSIRRWKRRERYEIEAGKNALEMELADNPSDLLIQKEEQQIARRVLAEMNPRSARLLILRYSGMTYRDIAVILDTAPSSIGPLLLRAEKEFKRRCQSAGLEEKK